MRLRLTCVRRELSGFYRRYLTDSVEGLRTRSKRPKTSPNVTHADIVGKIIYLRQHQGRPSRGRPYRLRYGRSAESSSASRQS
ncbi:hypothetical protein HDA40_000769 [Hamadaea flava]|nr:hypothetical protein [Hamadaea flava]